MITVFVDAGPLYALSVPRDQYHKKTTAVISKLKKDHIQPITSDYVLNEAITSIITSQKGSYRLAMQLTDWLFEKPAIVRIEWITQSIFFKSLLTFRRFNKDKQWSFTDCTSYVLIKELKIDQVFTFDKHFKQMGFSILS